jgi:DNA-binding MarR family transcriptional regulator
MRPEKVPAVDILACVQATSISSKSVAQELGALFKEVMTSTSHDFFAALDAAGLSFTQVKCLGLLGAADSLSVSALADELVISLAAASRAVDALVQRGEVTRVEDARDRRSRLVSITPRGRRTFEELIAVRRAGVERLLAGLDPSELEGLSAALRPILERLES